MTSTIEMAKSLLTPPGFTIQEHLDFIGMSQAELAERMGRPKEKINDIIKGREPISILTAFQLEKVLGIAASFWLNSERSYRTKLYELQQQEELEKRKDWLKDFPIREMKKLGWIPGTVEKYKMVDSLLKFFGVASPEEWTRIYLDEELSIAFRISLAQTASPHAISAWLRKGELQAMEMNVAEFNKQKLKASQNLIREIAFVNSPDFSIRVQKIYSECGVAIVFTPTLPGVHLTGATRWFRNNPIIQLPVASITNSQFWFTFFHETAHILLHGKKEVFIENLEGTCVDKQKEEEADFYASKILAGRRGAE